jgi:hypothetical protein
MEHITTGRIKVQCANCGKQFIKWRTELHKNNFHAANCYFDFIRKGKHDVIGLSAERHPNWQGGRTYINEDGYRLVWAFHHPRAHQNVVREHILVMEKKLGRFLKKGEEIHHINHIRDDNRPENLELCSSHSKHLSTYKHPHHA